MQIRGFGLASAIAIGSWAAAVIAQQRPEPATGFILGRVVDAATGQGVGGAAVTLQGSSQGLPKSVLADGDGNYLFHSLPAGTFRVFATAFGYLPESAYGARRPAGRAQPIELSAGQRIGDADIRIWPPASIAGTVIDDVGEAIANAQLGLFRYVTRAGQRRLVIVNGAATDESGAYRFGRLAPGPYLVWLVSQRTTIPVSTRELIDRAQSGDREASQAVGLALVGAYPLNITATGYRIGDSLLAPPFGSLWVGPPPDANGHVLVVRGAFHPGVPSTDQATAIAVAAGEQRTRIDFTVRLEPSVRVSGIVTGPAGPVANLPIRLVSSELGALESDEAFEAAMTITDARGGFTFLGVPSGAYRLDGVRIPPATRARPGPDVPGTLIPISTEPTIVVRQPIAVGDSDVVNVTATATYGPRLRGRIEFQGAAADAIAGLAARARVTLQSTDGRVLNRIQPPEIRVTPAGGIESAGLLPGRYVIRVDDVPGWIAASATVNGRDVIDAALEIENDDINGLVITMSNRPAGIAGVVRGADNSPDPNAAVVVFTADRSQWVLPQRRMASVRVSRAGAYRIESLPDGEYFVAALDDAVASDWQEAAFLESLSRQALRVTLAAGEVRTQDLRTVVLR
ncbi:MAG TPA: carboxypeptidase-like regulatory domain-containing protein [Vicinamibacterales bacterium]|nr:carboxypeptidase-like regulatory domain-containing protein [Vicinamibacterales bacterium]